MENIRACPKLQALALNDVFAYLRGGLTGDAARHQLCTMKTSDNPVLRTLMAKKPPIVFHHVTDSHRRNVAHIIPNKETLIALLHELCTHYAKSPRNQKLLAKFLDRIQEFCALFPAVFPGLWNVENEPIVFSYMLKPTSRHGIAVQAYIDLTGKAPLGRNTSVIEKYVAKRQNEPVCKRQRTRGSDLARESALLIIDMQNDFCLPGSPLYVSGAMECLPKVVKAVNLARTCHVLVVWVCRQHHASGCDIELSQSQHFEKGYNGVCIQDSIGASLMEPLLVEESDLVVWKKRWSGFFQTSLDMSLKRYGINHVVLAGVQTPNCIRSTAYDAIALDYPQVTVLSDATASKSDEVQAYNLEDMSDASINIHSVGEWEQKLLAAVSLE